MPVRIKLLGFSSFVALAVGVSVMLIGTSSALGHSLAGTCTPIATTPSISSHLGHANGEVTCTAGAPGYTYDNNMVAAGGSPSWPYSNTVGAPGPSDLTLLHAANANCNGYSVHTFVYINVGGAGKSDTSGSISC